MSEGHLGRVQKVAAQLFYLTFYSRVEDGVFSPAAVRRVAHYRVAYVCEVDADLMCATGLYLHFEERKLRKPIRHFK